MIYIARDKKRNSGEYSVSTERMVFRKGYWGLLDYGKASFFYSFCTEEFEEEVGIKLKWGQQATADLTIRKIIQKK